MPADRWYNFADACIFGLRTDSTDVAERFNKFDVVGIKYGCFFKFVDSHIRHVEVTYYKAYF
jgi:hypothetical protein